MTSIEELSPGHFDLVAQWLSDAGITRWLTSEWRGHASHALTIAMMARNARNRLFLVRSGDRPVGLVALSDIDLVDATAMAWYLLGDRDVSRQGVMTCALRLLADRAFADLKLESVYAWVMEDNVASSRVLEKAGFRVAGRLRRATRSADHQVDRVYFDLTAADLLEA